MKTASTFCRLCTASCPTTIEFNEGLPVRVMGDRSTPLYGGYTCVKGRSLPKIHLNPDRLLFSLKKEADGRHHRIGTDQAITEIGNKLSRLLEEHGPRSIALYYGNSVVPYPVLSSVAASFMNAIGSPMSFSAATLDQPGLPIANALHGKWLGGRIASAEADAALIVGGNPVISKQYLSQNPARQLKDGVNAGMKLIVIDPRSTETARRAHIHLQIRPGEDVSVLAGLVRLLIADGAIDQAFLAENVDGFDQLARAVEPFNPQYVAARAGISADDLHEAARILGEARKAYIAGGTGISMTGHGNLCFYLLLCLQSIRGFWPRAGDMFTASAVLTAKVEPKAQPLAPWGAFTGASLRVRDLKQSVAGFPTSGLPEEILTPGEGRIRALICLGNPLAAWPDSALAHEAMSKLELLVIPNVEFSETARLAHYVLATKQILETPATTQLVEITKNLHHGYGWDVPYAQYTPALLDPPAESDLIEEWQLFYRVAREMGRPLQLFGVDGTPSQYGDGEPSSDEVIDLVLRGSGVPLDEVRRHPTGKIYRSAQQIVGPRDPDCRDRLNIADAFMLEELAGVAAESVGADDRDPYRFRLITRRNDAIVNSMHRRVPGIHKMRYNPAYMAPDDLDRLGLQPGSLISIRSRYGEVKAVLASDDTLRPGVVSISHGYGAAPEEDDDPFAVGTNVNRLLRMDVDHDPISGIPRMGAVAVAVAAA
nr:molybdopterin-dependent oxidoreductase [Tardibacter chloracetimidivorans]